MVKKNKNIDLLFAIYKFNFTQLYLFIHFQGFEYLFLRDLEILQSIIFDNVLKFLFYFLKIAYLGYVSHQKIKKILIIYDFYQFSQDPGAESINNKIKEAVQQALQYYVVEEKYFDYQEELYWDQELHKNYQKQIIEKKLSDLTTKPIQFRIQVNENQSKLNEHYNE